MDEKRERKFQKGPRVGRGGPGGPGGAKSVERAKDFKGTTKKLMGKYLSEYKWKLIIVFIFAIAGTARERFLRVLPFHALPAVGRSAPNAAPAVLRAWADAPKPKREWDASRDF